MAMGNGNGDGNRVGNSNGDTAIAMATAMARATMTRGGLPLHVQFTEQPSVCPLYYSGAQKSCQPTDALPPPLLFHIFAKVSLGKAWIVYLKHAALWHG
jgi:hypothetical protein